MTNILEKYIFNLFEKELGLGEIIAPFIPIPALPFMPKVPSPFDFETRRRTTFPIPKVPTPDLDIFDEADSSETPPEITIDTITGDLSSYLNQPTEPKSSIDEKLGLKLSKELASGQNRVTGMGGALSQFATLTGLSATMLDAIGEKSKKNLENIAAKAALGFEGYGIGRVNNQTVGVGPGLLGVGTTLSGTLPSGLTSKQQSEIIDALEGKSGALGPAKAEYSIQRGRFDMDRPLSQAMLDFEDTVLNTKDLAPDLKASLLGYDRLTNPFERSQMPTNYYTVTPFEQIQADKEQTTKNRTGNVDSGFTDVSDPSLGFETDIDAQRSQVNPMGINLGIDMDNISGVPIGLNTAPTFAPDPFYSSSDDDDDDDASTDTGSVSEGGYGGIGATAYGGKIGMFGGGFASKVEKIKGVGLIEPDKTFLDTDVVRDRFEFDAENGDYIVNGPASNDKSKEIKFLVNEAINELQKEGVDIRIGNPKIKSKNKVPLVVASSETYIPKVIAEKIGYSILDGLNNTGKAEVTRLKNKLDDKPTDKGKYQANEGMRVGDPRQGFLFGNPKINVTGPNIDRSEDAFVPGISDEPVEIKPDDERFFNYYSLRDIKDAIYEKEMKGYKDRGYIFTGVRAKAGKGSSAFGTMQITYSTIEDFIKRSQGYKEFSPELKEYTKNVAQQGRDKVNLEVNKALYRNDKRIPLNKISKITRRKLGRLGQGVIPQEVHEKYYDELADAVLRQKLKDYKNKGIRPFLESYGEGKEYGEDVYNILLDKIQIKNSDNNSSATQ